MRNSVLMTVYNREHIVLENVLIALFGNDMRDAEVIIVDDGSTLDYEDIKGRYDARWITVDTCKDRPGTYNIDGYNNPAYAWNCAIEASQGDRLIFLSSDCIMQPDAIRKARGAGERLWMPRVVDMGSGREMTGRQRAYPMGWMSSIKRKFVKPYDEEFLNGFDYDDNDFIASLAIAAGTVDIDTSCTLYHQSHKRVYYSDGLHGSETNRRYIESKWGGIPWKRDANDPISIRQRLSDKSLYLYVRLKECAVQHAEMHGVG